MLPLRVRDDSVEFAFRGECPGDASPWELLEYLVSGQDKAHESLLVILEADVARLAALERLFVTPAAGRRPVVWSAQLVWIDGGVPRAVALEDLVAKLGSEKRAEFLSGLRVNKAVIGGSLNVEADNTGLPRRRVPALVLLTVRRAGD